MLIGIKDKDKVILAFSTYDGYIPAAVDDLLNADNVGIWKIKKNPHTVMGCGFPTPEADAFRFEQDIFQGDIDYGSLTERIIPAMEDFAKGKEYIGNVNDRNEEFLIAQNERLFEISSEHIVCEIDSFAVIAEYGNEEVAKGVLSCTNGEHVLNRIIKAFEFAALTIQCDCYPISVIDTATGKIRIITRDRTKRRGGHFIG